MGTNYYFMSRHKELMQTYFAEKSEWGVFGEEYTIVDEPKVKDQAHSVYAQEITAKILKQILPYRNVARVKKK